MGPGILGSPCRTNQAPLAQIGVEKPFLVRRVAVVSQNSSAPVVFYSRDDCLTAMAFVDLAKTKPSAQAPVTAITKCLIQGPPVNRLTVAPRALSQCRLLL